MRTLSTVVLGTALLTLLPAAPAAQTEFFGEDLFGFPSSGSIVSRSLTFPNASDARAMFLAALTSDVGTEDFEGFAHLSAAPINLSFPGAGTATLTGNGRVRDYTVAGEWRGNDRYPTSGERFYDTDAGGDFVVRFASPVAAFGFFGVDIGDVGGQLFLDFVNAAGITTVTVPHTVGTAQSTTGGVIFYGRIAAGDPFTEVRFRNSLSSSDLFAFDDMTIGSAAQVQPPTSTVPEPLSVALLGTGLAGVAAARRRRATGQDPA